MPARAAGADTRAQATRRPSWWTLLLVWGGWLLLWHLTPGLLGHGLGSRFTDDDATAILIETLVAAGLAVPLLLTHRRYNSVLFARSRWMLIYAVPLGLAAGLPLHYEMPLPLGLYLVWMGVSVFWQDYLTFGLLQSYLRERLPTAAVVLVVAPSFYLAHAVTIPEQFAPVHAAPALGILALGFVMALLREWTGTLHLVLAAHLAFYFVFA